VESTFFNCANAASASSVHSNCASSRHEAVENLEPWDDTFRAN
jgi:hypothetical protein